MSKFWDTTDALGGEQLPALVAQLRGRNLFTNVQKTLKDLGLPAGVSWRTIGAGLSRAAEEEDHRRRIGAFVTNAIRFSQKRLYVIRDAGESFNSLGAKAETALRQNFLKGLPKESKPEGVTHVSFYVGKEDLGTNTVAHTFVTTRPAVSSVKLSVNMLHPANQDQYKNAEIFARKKELIRCFDQIIVLKRKTALLLVDAPETVDGRMVERDVQNYLTIIKGAWEIPKNKSPFRDLFRAIDSIYQAPEEGVLNYLEFRSDDLVRVKGSNSPDKKEFDYRRYRYHEQGKKHATIEPYRIAVRWPDKAKPDRKRLVTHADRPYVVLPGNLSHLQKVLPLERMEFPLYTTWSGLLFAYKRVMTHVGSEDADEE